jgi:hypothetical protein
LDGSPYNGQTFRCAILAADTTATFVGDLVKLNGTAAADGSPSVVQAAATDSTIFGAVVSFEADPATSLDDQYRKASTLRYCQVAPALDNLFVVQCSGSSAITDIGEAADIVVGTGSTTTGMSAMELEATLGTGDTCTLLGLSREPNNEFGTNANLIVRISESVLRGDGTPV